MKYLRGTLYSQIALLYLLLMLAFTATALLISARQFDQFLEELEQRLNRSLAQHIVSEIVPTARTPATEAAARTVERIRLINPGVDVYFLGADGRVVESFTGHGPIREQIDIQPIRKFLSKDAMLPIRAADPSMPMGNKVFSAAPVALGGQPGYLYVILRGMSLATTANMLRTSYVVRGVVSVLGALLLATMLAGLVLFSLLTRRFGRLTATVRKFQTGDLQGRARSEPRDEIGRLGAAFNEMAATIAAQLEALQRTDEARRAMAANISHDFRTPLTSLRGYTERMLHADERLDAQQRRDSLQAVLHSAAVLEHLADELATIVQLDTVDAPSVPHETFSLAELAHDVAAKFAPLAASNNVKFNAQLSRELPSVRGHLAHIERVMSNLIDNAIKNTPAGGMVTLSLQPDSQALRVCVSDTGSGIPADELPLVTQRFFRTRASRAAGVSGTGLGLAIAREILLRHDSALHIESNAGLGTTICFQLRVAGGEV